MNSDRPAGAAGAKSVLVRSNEIVMLVETESRQFLAAWREGIDRRDDSGLAFEYRLAVMIDEAHLGKINGSLGLSRPRLTNM